MTTTPLSATVARLLGHGRGLLGADEHLDRLPTDDLAAEHRSMLLSTPGLATHISGVIVDADAISAATGPALGSSEDDLLLGVRIGSGLYQPTYDHARRRAPDDTMRVQLRELARLGVSFLKWRADLDPVAHPGDPAYIDAESLAHSARLSQQVGLVPILDIAMPALRSHSLSVATAVTANALRSLYAALAAEDVDAADTVVRMNVIRAGDLHAAVSTSEEVAAATVRVLVAEIPDEAPGVLFMSSGLDGPTACAHLAAISRCAASHGWTRPLGFAFGRALVAPATTAWLTARRGAGPEPHAVEAGQRALLHACRAARDAAGEPVG